jgi:hypothetical protein
VRSYKFPAFLDKFPALLEPHTSLVTHRYLRDWVGNGVRARRLRRRRRK